MSESIPGVVLTADCPAGCEQVLAPQALAFVAALTREFREQRDALLLARAERQAALDAGGALDFLPETRHIRESDWQVAPIPPDLQDRRTEITGPTERKMVINALNSGARVFMADFEDANSPTWSNLVEGQRNLHDAVRRSITFTNPDGRFYQLQEKTATLLVRPRGWHLDERHMQVDGAAVPGALFDFGLYFYHNARELLERGSGPYFYLPKLESHREARLWNEVFLFAQRSLDIPRGSIRATVLIETIQASFETEEILYELREHSAGLNCGRWDYIFSYIKTFSRRPDFILPDRASVTMTVPFMRNYTLNVIRVCHRRGIHAMGGMAAQIPIRHDPHANEGALEKVRQDKLREVRDGHDGTWVAHPGLIAVAQEVFDEWMPQPNQIDRLREEQQVSAADLLTACEGSITEQGARLNLRVGIQYLAAWLCGNGCVPLYSLMEDAATAEISRAQLWQWLHHRVRLEDGRAFDEALFLRLLDEEMAQIRAEVGAPAFAAGAFTRARALFDDMIRAERMVPFLTIPAYGDL